MDPKALTKAHRRYRVAQAAADSLATAPNHEAFGDRWYEFLHAAKGIYSMLETGSKATTRAKEWFGRKNRERKDDPLLRYVSEARNDDEHGLEEATEVIPQSVRHGVRAPGSSSAMRDEFGNTFHNCGAAYEILGGHFAMANLPKLTSLDGKPIKTAFNPARITLKRVHDRGGEPYDPPKEHLGTAMESGEPEEVARLALGYLRELIAEAERL